MSKKILDHHQAVDKKIHRVHDILLNPIHQDLIRPTENLVAYLEKSDNPTASIEAKKALIESFKALFEAVEALRKKYHETKRELERIEQAGEHDDVTLEKDQELAVKEQFQALINGAWQTGRFFEGMKARLQVIADNYDELIGLAPKKSHGKTMAELAGENLGITPDNESIEVFISLHNSRGGEQDAINTWQNLLATIGRQVINRPIYQREEDIQAFIRSAKDPNKEAYVCAKINKRFLMVPPGGVDLKDKEGRKLLTVKERSVTENEISKFVHISGTYELNNGKLTRLDDPDEKLDMGMTGG